MTFFKYFLYLALFFVLLFTSSCGAQKSLYAQNIEVAVIADAHLHNVYGELKDNDYKGIHNPKNNKAAFIRTMGSQLRSTRIFNESYFAFLAALDDVVKKNIKYVLLPGDFTDDGQPLHLRGLKNILDRYTKQHDITFLLIPGNHDVVHPYDHDSGKIDFLSEGGRSQAIISKPDLYNSKLTEHHPVILTQDIKNLGYKGVSNILSEYGLFPQKSNIYWASPFSNYTYASYNFEQAQKMASLSERSHIIPKNNAPLPDLSYLVEPVLGLWVLAIDANTYLKKATSNPASYSNTGKGHDNLLTDKKILVRLD